MFGPKGAAPQLGSVNYSACLVKLARKLRPFKKSRQNMTRQKSLKNNSNLQVHHLLYLKKGNEKWTFAKTKLEIKELFLTYSNKARQHCMRGRRRASKLTQLANKLGQALAFSVQVSVCVFME